MELISLDLEAFYLKRYWRLKRIILNIFLENVIKVVVVLK